jgi:tetratricopeptide (TPR) repeat protein
MPNLNSSASEDRSNFLAINQQILSKLLTFVDFAAGLTIGFIEIDREQERDWIVDWLIDAPQCQDIQFLVLTYESPDLRFLLDEILKSLPQDLPTDKNLVLIIKGLEYSIGHTEYPPVLQNLNFVRDAFVDAVPYPIIFCLPSYQITSFANYAPDFWAWKSGLFKFESVEQEQIFVNSSPVDYTPIRRTPEPQSRIDLLLRLLVEYEADPNNVNLSTVVSILQQLGSVYRSRQEWKEAEADLIEALRIVEENPSLSIPNTNISIDLADVYREQRKYDEAEQLCHQVLNLNRDFLSHQQWAETNYILGLIYTNNPKGNIAENLENAIACFQSVLTIYTYEDFPQAWAQTQNNLGNVYWMRIRGDRAQNLEQAIEYYRLALQVRSESDFPQAWAQTQHNLASAYHDRIWGDRADNLELAIEYYQATLRVLTERDFPFNWATTQYNLGNTYYNRIRGDRSENLELAIEYSQMALRVLNEADFPQDWARIQHNLATTYQERIRGDRSENLEMAIEYYQAALRVHTERDFPFNWAMIQSNLGLTYTQRIKGEKAENIKMAIECYQNALKVYTPDTFPREWEQIQNLLQAISSDSSPLHP